MTKINRVLISLSDKTGLIDFAKNLEKRGVQIISTGGTCKALKKAGISVREVSSYTSSPEIMDGRVKTLHPKIHGGILCDRDNKAHLSDAELQNISMIDMVVVNLYPFVETVQKGSSQQECIENIDIGGPTMIRSAAKNFNHVSVVVSNSDFDKVIELMDEHDNEIPLEERFELSKKAFTHVADYDIQIANWFMKNSKLENEKLYVSADLNSKLRYGENPSQEGYVYENKSSKAGLIKARQLQGKEASYNNYNDGDTAIKIVAEFFEPCCAIIKHANPCGVSVHENIAQAYKNALGCDSTSAFGGIVAFNREINKEVAEELSKIFLEIIVAPSISDEALEILFSKNTSIFIVDDMHLIDTNKNMKSLIDGYLIQDEFKKFNPKMELECVTDKKPTEQELEDLKFAWQSIREVKSNAILFAKNKTTIGIGAGQMSRVDSALIAVKKANDALEKGEGSGVKGSVVASDAFFPFADALEHCIEAGITAVIQPGGSKNDASIISLANKHGIAMVFANERLFKH